MKKYQLKRKKKKKACSLALSTKLLRSIDTSRKKTKISSFKNLIQPQSIQSRQMSTSKKTSHPWHILFNVILLALLRFYSLVALLLELLKLIIIIYLTTNPQIIAKLPAWFPIETNYPDLVMCFLISTLTVFTSLIFYCIYKMTVALQTHSDFTEIDKTSTGLILALILLFTIFVLSLPVIDAWLNFWAGRPEIIFEHWLFGSWRKLLSLHQKWMWLNDIKTSVLTQVKLDYPVIGELSQKAWLSWIELEEVRSFAYNSCDVLGSVDARVEIFDLFRSKLEECIKLFPDLPPEPQSWGDWLRSLIKSLFKQKYTEGGIRIGNYWIWNT